MPESAARHYQTLPETVQEQGAVSWKTFFVLSAGKTNEAHHDFVKKLKGFGQTEVDSPEECDYILVFCPVASRVGTDIGEALENTPADKPIILVVMHHTFKTDHVVAESRRLVTNLNVHLTVDCLFDEKFLECERNDTAWSEIKRYLGVSQECGYVPSIILLPNNRLAVPKYFIYIGIPLLILLLILFIVWVLIKYKKI